MVVTSVNLSPEVLQWLERNAGGNISAFLNSMVKSKMAGKKSDFGSLRHLKGLNTIGLKEKIDRVDRW